MTVVSDRPDGPDSGTAREAARRDGHVRVAVGQVAAGTDPSANRAAVAAVVAEAAAHSPDLIVLPEAVMHDFGRPDLDLGPIAEPLDGPFVAAVAAAAAAARAVVVGGMFERREVGGTLARPYNTVVAIGPDGHLLAHYRKLHLYDAFTYRESERLSAGAEEPPVLRVGGMQVGIMTCYDLRFPEVGRLLVDAGAEAILVPAAWQPGSRKVAHWQALLTARAIENTAYVLGAAQPGPRYTGHSAIVDPMGVVVTAAGESAQLLYADLDPAVVATARRINPSLANRRFAVVRR